MKVLGGPRLPDPYIEPLLSIEGSAPYLGLGRSAAYSAANSGTLPTITVNGRRRVRTSDIYELLGLPIPPHDD